MRRAPEVGLPPAGSKTFARPRLQDPPLLVQKSASRYRLRKRLRIFTGDHIPPFPDREPLGLFPRPATPLRPQHPAHPLSKTHRTSQTESASHFRTSGLARLLPARAASENLPTSHLKIKYFLMRAQKNFLKKFLRRS
jgi:hypothetical protein